MSSWEHKGKSPLRLLDQLFDFMPHLTTWLAPPDDGAPATAAVEREFRRDLECGILAHGFARARCTACRQDFLIAYSCKGRGVCPACTTWRMVETAAHLAKHVLPRLPVHPWVPSVPKRLRYFLPNDPAIETLALHIFLSGVKQALRQGCPAAGRASRIGAIAFLHLFGALLNLHVHCHCIVLEGVFEADEGGGSNVSRSSSTWRDANHRLHDGPQCRA